MQHMADDAERKVAPPSPAHPPQGRFGEPCRRILGTHPARVAYCIQVVEEEREIDFTGTRLVTPGIVGKLDMPYPR